MKVLVLTSHFSPNIGGVETHLDDLVKALAKRHNDVFVLTYSPLTTTGTKWKIYEKKRNVKILRIPWFGGFFYKLAKYPILEYLYLFPGLFVVLPFVIFFYSPKVIHTHGLISGFVGVFWAKICRIHSVTTTHSLYNFPALGMYRSFAKWIFSSSNKVLVLSKKSKQELLRLGVNKNKVDIFTYWVDTTKFKPSEVRVRPNGILKVLFVGRLVEEKGVLQLLAAIPKLKENVKITVAGTGPLEDTLRKKSEEYTSLDFVGALSQEQLPMFYSQADILIVPSTHQEGFGRVVLESLACGTPVIGSKLGSISEALDERVGELITPNPKSIAASINKYASNKKRLTKLAKNARKFAVSRYSEKNVETIISSYL